MWESFHGATLDAISIGGEAIFRDGIGPLLPDCLHVNPPEPSMCLHGCGDSCTADCANDVAEVLEREGDVAAVIAEPIRCTPCVPPKEYWQRVREACDQHGSLLIFDEIPTALGRTGRMFVCEHFGAEPDMLVIGKGLGGGVFPMAALIAREGLDVAGRTALGHFTHEKSPVGCAAALATLEVIEEEGLCGRAAELGEHAITRLREAQQSYPIIHEVRGLGLQLGVELRRADGSRATDEAEQVMYAALERGLSFKTTMGSILTLTPPLIITRDELDRAIDILIQAIKEATTDYTDRHR
jgi:4-aminobutyrate aminotransferase